MAAYYNENDPKAAAWLRELIKAGLIADGEVDERSITDVRPGDLAGFVQCHFFAGIGGWSYALRLAGWPDDRAVWTGSCPCQPFSSAGKALSADDPRHLWPAWFQLLRECRPPVVFGEQVASKDGLAWFDLVSTDVEAEDYAIGAVDLCAAGVGAPHIRQRLWFVAESDERRRRSYWEYRRRAAASGGRPLGPDDGPKASDAGASRVMADAEHAQRRALDVDRQDERDGDDAGRPEAHGEPGACGEVCSVGHSGGSGLPERERDGSVQREALGPHEGQAAQCGGNAGELADAQGSGWRLPVQQRGPYTDRAKPERGSEASERERSPWADAEWIACRDGKQRPVEPGTFPLVAGLSRGMGRVRDASEPFHPAEARVMRLRGYGNSIMPQVAAQFVAAYMELGHA